jgi:hypothetical protein
MTEESKKSEQPTLPGMSDAISSPGSPGGITPYSSPDGAAPSGPAPAPANHFPSRESVEALRTTDICGLFGETSSPSVALQRSLESRLLARMDAYGSLEYALTWKHWDIGS